ncbi:hypothetical protein AVEN_150174-1 [Araneus ventricosus]|uniref:Uncharacterized protein n=1 Tax=Araneus ventricosus TaxID=182803 RepID=A0A4Y2CZT8_ARAVE|nr:hypothetical protein AVEN_150174-1 [Araneus ventricosus]
MRACALLGNRQHTFVKDKFFITTTNIDISDGLANDAHGKLVHMEFNEEITCAEYGGISRPHIYKPYPDRTEAGNQPISLATRGSDVVFSSRT